MTLPLAAAPVASPDAGATIPVTVTWTGSDAPSGVFFDDGAEVPLTPNAERTQFTGTRQAAPRSHLLIVRYADDDVPLMLRITPTTQPISLRVFRARATDCAGSSAEQLRRDSLAASSTAKKMEVMLRGRRMYQVPGCTNWVKRIAAQVYFTRNCDLAKSHEFLDLTEEAKRWFVESAVAINRPAAEAEVAACLNQARGRTVATLFTLQNNLIASDQTEQAREINSELHGLAKDPDWAGGFSAVKLDREIILNNPM
ncbi:hypothetical protein [Sphingomonas soli]|uniref:hypothetical protein n=1 Tax=Sphingomonas soli TaxID=266127 RepID=UPI000830334A|nr:hypothetical protein [Sphingomonas soli]